MTELTDLIEVSGEMLNLAASFARDEKNDVRTRVGAALAATKIAASTATIINTRDQMECRRLDWAARILERNGAGLINRDDPVDALKFDRAVAIINEQAQPRVPVLPKW